MVAGIYAIVNRETGDRYVGSTGDLLEREQGHLSRLRHNRHPNPHLQAAWNKYGETAFEFVVLEEVAPALLLQAEQAHIDQKAEYNILTVAGRQTGYKHTEESKRKMSAALVGRIGHPQSETSRQKISAGLTGLPRAPHSEEARAKMSAARSGRLATEAHRQAQRDGHARRRARLAAEAAV